VSSAKHALALLLLLAACGRVDEAPPEGTPTRQARPEKPDLPSLKEVADASKAEGKTLPQAQPLTPTDLAVVFTNNVDGEIEPCG
jgi:hypothetical protein